MPPFRFIYNKARKENCKVIALPNQKGGVRKTTALCKQQGFSVNDYLIAKMMWEDNTNKVIIVADIRNRIGCYRQGALGNYSTAFGVAIKKKGKDMISLAKQIASKVADIIKQPRKEMLVLAC